MTPPRKPSRQEQSLTELLDIMAKLRDPSGCPWDREQTPRTLKRFLMEETYEALEAIETGSRDALKEELGDLLLQIVFLSRIAEEEGVFNFWDVVHTLRQKLIRRHPHIFSSGRAGARPSNAEDVARLWSAIKKSEAKHGKRRSLLDGLPLALPALERAQRISERVSRAGFDWPTIDAVWEKIQEELTELKSALRRSSRKEIEEELGDLLFTIVNLARFRGLSAEEALRRANRKFAKRFRGLESELRRRGKSLDHSTLKEMDQIWTLVKNRKAAD